MNEMDDVLKALAEEMGDATSEGANITAAFLTREVLGELTESVESLVHERGWDQPPRLFAVTTSDHLGDQLDRVGGEVDPELLRDGVAVGDEGAVAALVVTDVGTIEGDPAVTLLGEHAPGYAGALILCAEAWVDRGDDERDEVRLATAVTRLGAEAHTLRVRGSEVETATVPPIGEGAAEGEDVASGTLASTLRRMFRLPTRPPRGTPEQWMERLWATALDARLQQWQGPVSRDDLSSYEQTRPDRVLVDSVNAAAEAHGHDPSDAADPALLARAADMVADNEWDIAAELYRILMVPSAHSGDEGARVNAVLDAMDSPMVAATADHRLVPADQVDRVLNDPKLPSGWGQEARRALDEFAAMVRERRDGAAPA